MLRTEKDVIDGLIVDMIVGLLEVRLSGDVKGVRAGYCRGHC